MCNTFVHSIAKMRLVWASSTFKLHLHCVRVCVCLYVSLDSSVNAVQFKKYYAVKVNASCAVSLYSICFSVRLCFFPFFVIFIPFCFILLVLFYVLHACIQSIFPIAFVVVKYLFPCYEGIEKYDSFFSFSVVFFFFILSLEILQKKQWHINWKVIDFLMPHFNSQNYNRNNNNNNNKIAQWKKLDLCQFIFETMLAYVC